MSCPSGIENVRKFQKQINNKYNRENDWSGQARCRMADPNCHLPRMCLTKSSRRRGTQTGTAPSRFCLWSPSYPDLFHLQMEKKFAREKAWEEEQAGGKGSISSPLLFSAQAGKTPAASFHLEKRWFQAQFCLLSRRMYVRAPLLEGGHLSKRLQMGVSRCWCMGASVPLRSSFMLFPQIFIFED